VAELGEEPGGHRPSPLVWVKKKIAEGRKAGREAPPLPSPLVQGLDPPLYRILL